MHIHAYTCIHMHTHAYTCIHMYTHAYTCIHMHTHEYTWIHRHTHAYTGIQMHTHAYSATHIARQVILTGTAPDPKTPRMRPTAVETSGNTWQTIYHIRHNISIIMSKQLSMSMRDQSPEPERLKTWYTSDTQHYKHNPIQPPPPHTPAA
jgi:hypothetical protein